MKAHILRLLVPNSPDDWLFESIRCCSPGKPLTCADDAAAAGATTMLQRFLAQGERCSERAVDQAAINGHLHILRHLEQLDQLTPTAALVLLYHATSGDSWKNRSNWCSDAPLDQWRGVKNGKEKRLALNRNRLAGTLPRGISALGSELVSLHLSHNQLTGRIPESIGRLGALRDLNLSDNCLQGPIPSSLGDLTNLRTLRLDCNQLTGQVPDALSNLSELQSLWLGHLCLSEGAVLHIVSELQALDTLQMDKYAVPAAERAILAVHCKAIWVESDETKSVSEA